MNKIAYPPIRFVNYLLLGVLLMPFAADATMFEQESTGKQPVIMEAGTCSDATDIDHITQHVNKAKHDLLVKNSSDAKKNLKYAYKELQNIGKTNAAKVNERITITHGPKLQDPGYLFLNTATAYYSPTMQDMRLLRMAVANLKAGKSHAACSELSAVRFPYVSADAQLTISKMEKEVRGALTNLQLHKSHVAMADIDKFTVTAGSYASIFQP
jgi:hypothetical protein